MFPNGEYNENHYTCAKDLAIISSYAMKNSYFREVVSTTTYTVEATNKYGARNLANTNALILPNTANTDDNYYYSYAIGVKTGATEGKECLIASARRNGLEFLIVVMGAGSTDNGLSERYVDCKTLFDYGFNNYIARKIIAKGEIYGQVLVSGATNNSKKLNLVYENDVYACVAKEDENKIFGQKVDVNKKLSAPVEQGSKVGTITISVDGKEYTGNIVAGDEVTKSYTLISLVLLGSALFLLFNYRRKKFKYRKNHHVGNPPKKSKL